MFILLERKSAAREINSLIDFGCDVGHEHGLLGLPVGRVAVEEGAHLAGMAVVVDEVVDVYFADLF
jgi:hypothetical protein